MLNLRNLTLDYSIKSLDELEGWLLSNFKHHNDLIAQKKLLDYITIYIGETVRKHIGGKSQVQHRTAIPSVGLA